MTSSPSRQRTVLVVDDYEAQRYAMSRLLQQAGFAVLVAGTGEESLARARQHPDVILLDVGLPDMTGFEVCRRLKANPEPAEAPVVFVSGTYMSPDDVVQGEKVGGCCFLFHPVSVDHLLVVIEGALAKAAHQKPVP